MGSTSGGDASTGFILLACLVALYFAPSIVAVSRNHHNSLSIFLLNLFLGWTLVGWVAALVWSVSNPSKSIQAETLPDAQPPGPPNEATKTCPQCAETLKAAAKICRFCRYEFPAEPVTLPAPALDSIERAAREMMAEYGDGAEEKAAHYCERIRQKGKNAELETGEQVLAMIRRLHPAQK